ncbi:hypothetical protein AHAS_Ahas11G0204800 [Arachis hypogaea]
MASQSMPHSSSKSAITAASSSSATMAVAPRSHEDGDKVILLPPLVTEVVQFHSEDGALRAPNQMQRPLISGATTYSCQF